MKVACGFTPSVKPIKKKNSNCFKIEFFHRKGIIDRQAIEIFPLSSSDMQAQGDINQRTYASLDLEPTGNSSGKLALQIPLSSNVTSGVEW